MTITSGPKSVLDRKTSPMCRRRSDCWRRRSGWIPSSLRPRRSVPDGCEELTPAATPSSHFATATSRSSASDPYKVIREVAPSASRDRCASRSAATGCPSGAGGALEVALHVGAEGARVDRLAQVPVEAKREQPLPIAAHRERGDGDDRQVAHGRVAAQLAQQLLAAAARDLDVEQHHVHRLPAQLDPSLVHAFRLDHLVAAVPQDVADQPPVERVVLHHQEAARFHAAGSSGGSGSSTVKVEPRPTSLATEIVPPCSSTRRRERARPRPVPSRLAPSGSSCSNSRKSRGRSSERMPTPVSSTTIRSRSPSARARRRTTPPAGVNLMALESRL